MGKLKISKYSNISSTTDPPMPFLEKSYTGGFFSIKKVEITGRCAADKKAYLQFSHIGNRQTECNNRL